MWIKRIEITHFQKHDHLILDFTDEVNVLYGATDTGKSCIRRAVAWVVFNKTLKKDGVRQEGTKQTSVKIWRENGVIVERIKSNSINRYLLTKEGKTEVFDSVGKEIPEPIKEALGVSTIEVDGEELVLNISKQIALPFLLDKSGTFRMKLFNKITGNDVVDEVLQSFNKDILSVSKKEKLQSEILESRKAEKEEINKILEEKKSFYIRYKEKFDKILEKMEKLDKLNKVSEKLNSINIERKKIDLEDIPEISDNKILEITNNITKLNILNSSLAKIEIIKKEKNNAIKLLSNLKFPKINLEKLDIILLKFKKLLNIKHKIEELNNRKKQLINNLEESNTIRKTWIKKYKELLLKSDKCPTCKQSLDSKKISEIEL